ncbi:hypothetical protein DNK49_23430, partial [Azoarcus communis]
LRAQHNRCLPQGGKLWPETLAAPSLGEIEFMLPARTNRPARAIRRGGQRIAHRGAWRLAGLRA